LFFFVFTPVAVFVLILQTGALVRGGQRHNLVNTMQQAGNTERARRAKQERKLENYFSKKPKKDKDEHSAV
jgi:hypothetical protein